MLKELTLAYVALAQDPSKDTPVLRVGERIEGEITDADSVISTPTLDKRYRTVPVVGTNSRTRIEESGPYTIELRSLLFDSYLVLRDGAGKLVSEDDDGLIATHSRIVVELERGDYELSACALHGQRGAFELTMHAGRPPELSPQERAMGQRTEMERRLAVVEKVRGPEHADTAACLASLATRLQAQGDYAGALPCFERALAIYEKARGPEHADTAWSLNNLANLLYAQRDYASALPYYERALDIREKTSGPEHIETARSLNNLANLLLATGDYSSARLHHERALAITEKVLGPEHPETARSLNGLAEVLKAQGDYSRARSSLERVVAIREKALGPEHVDTARSLNSLATLLYDQGDYSSALPYYERALGIREKVLGPEHIETARSLNNLANLFFASGNYSGARLNHERALAITEKVLGPEHPETARSLNNLGLLLQDQGDYAGARTYYQRALEIDEKSLGSEQPGIAIDLSNLASLLYAQGDYSAARTYYERALAIREKTLGPEHRETAQSLNNLALLLQDQGDLASARPYHERALAIFEKTIGPEHPETATSLNNLALLLQDQGDHAGARLKLERALAICEKALGPEHPETATSLNNLALLLQDQGDYERSLSHHRRALAVYEDALGPEHPLTVTSLSNLGILFADQGLKIEAREHAYSALRLSVRHAEHNLWSLSERERMGFLGQGEVDLLLCLSPSILDTRGGGREGYELSLEWRGLVSRTMLASRSRLVENLPEGAATTIETLHAVQAKLSKLLYASQISDRERHARELRELRQLRNELELVVQRLAGPRVERAPKPAELERSLNVGSAFVDFFVHSHYRPAELEGERVVRKGDWSEEHLSAWIVRPDRELTYLDLGLATDIERAAQDWLRAIVSDAPLVAARGVGVSAKSDTGIDGGRRLTSILWAPLAVHLDGVRQVFVRPDSFLGTLPFEVIPIEGGRFLIEEMQFVYLQTPDDLLKQAECSSISSLLSVGGVDFGKRAGLSESAQAAAVTIPAALSVELRGRLGRSWPRLTNTESEVLSVNESFEASSPEGARLMLLGDAPTEERLKQELPGHSVAHLATHGYFHPAGTVSMWDSAQEEAGKRDLQGVKRETRALVGELPGLLSGLVCAGANDPAPPGRDDGLLTAEEVIWLDLSRVDLVVLSACETALGERRSGEGMIGLRRAFGLAGAKTVVSSLWAVRDQSTSELMQRFYQNLWLKHEGRAEALRHAQLDMLARNRASEHGALPSTWGAFVLSGEWR